MSLKDRFTSDVFLLIVSAVLAGLGALYGFFGQRAIPELLNDAAKPYDVLSISCGNGYSISVQAKEETHVRNEYGGASYMKSLAGTMSFQTPHSAATFALTDGADGIPLGTSLPFAAEADMYVFPRHLPPEDRYDFSQLYDEPLGNGTGESGSGFKYIGMKGGDFTREDFAAFTDCLKNQQAEKKTTLYNQTELLHGIFSIAYMGNARMVDWNPSAAAFWCDAGLSVSLLPPRYVALLTPDGYRQRIGLVLDDGSARPFTAEELETQGASSYSMSLKSFKEYDDCIRFGKGCPADAVVKVAKGSGYEMKTVTKARDPYYYDWEMNYMRDYYRAQLKPLGLENGLPASFDSCKNPQGQTIKAYIESSPKSAD